MMALSYLKFILEEPPEGCQIDIMWHEHELGDFPSIGLFWNDPQVDPPWGYINRCTRSLEIFDEAIDWHAIDPEVVAEELSVLDEDKTNAEDNDFEDKDDENYDEIPDMDKIANGLINIAKGSASAIFALLMDQFPILQLTDLEEWDFIYVVACVYMSASALPQYLMDFSKADHILSIIEQKLKTWHHAALNGLDDCQKYVTQQCDLLVEAGHDAKFLHADALGIWVVWNVFDKRPETHEEMQLSRTIGSIIIHDFGSIWNIIG